MKKHPYGLLHQDVLYLEHLLLYANHNSYGYHHHVKELYYYLNEYTNLYAL
ncbi:hypothetical protein [Bacteroides hominis]